MNLQDVSTEELLTELMRRGELIETNSENQDFVPPRPTAFYRRLAQPRWALYWPEGADSKWAEERPADPWPC